MNDAQDVFDRFAVRPGFVFDKGQVSPRAFLEPHGFVVELEPKGDLAVFRFFAELQFAVDAGRCGIYPGVPVRDGALVKEHGFFLSDKIGPGLEPRRCFFAPQEAEIHLQGAIYPDTGLFRRLFWEIALDIAVGNGVYISLIP